MAARNTFTVAGIAGLGLLVAAGSALAADYAADRTVTIHRHARSYKDVPRAGIGGPVIVPLDNTGVFFQTPFYDVAVPGGPDELVRLPHYQKPDGSYDGLYGLSSSIQGYPCGQDCTNQSLTDWGYAPAY